MGSLELPARSRPARSAATKAALAIRSEAQDDHNYGAKTDKPERHSDRNFDAFQEIMSSRVRSDAKSKPPLSKSKKVVVPRLSMAISPATSLVPDLEDLVEDATQVRISRRHSPDYHRFTTLASRGRVHEDVLAWYDIHHRKLPWRRDFHSQSTASEEKPGQRAYEVWVSEIMCQQTQVATVIPYYNTWMAKWPTIADLAAADLEEVNKVWTGLGYYSRASRLHSGAQKVLKEFDGVLPSDPAVLEKEVPGIGRYTAGAIVSHAYNVPAELVDGNVIRVLSRLRAIGGDVKSPKVIDLHWQIAKELVHQDRPGCFNQGLMELGAVICTPQNPRCGECPVQTSCRAYAEMLDAQTSRQEAIGVSRKRVMTGDNTGDDDSTEVCHLCLPQEDMESKDQGLITQYPRKAIKKAPRDEECAVSILERTRVGAEGKTISEFLLVKRPEKGLLAGMWEFPTVEQEQLRLDHKQADGPSTYKQRSESSMRFLIDTLKFDWIKTCKVIQKRDLGSVQHLFSHIRKVYHVEWVLVDDGGESSKNEKNSRRLVGYPEVEWLTPTELADAAIPTGINKTFQLLQKHKAGADSVVSANSSGGKRKKIEASDVKKDRRVKKDDGHADISKFFKSPSK